jgi:hypothetical protein
MDQGGKRRDESSGRGAKVGEKGDPLWSFWREFEKVKVKMERQKAFLARANVLVLFHVKHAAVMLLKTGRFVAVFPAPPRSTTFG